jgi:5-bromo-4-chloroindolyl phosphate hydrolysis protein
LGLELIQEICGKFIDIINNSKESRRNQSNAVSNAISNSFIIKQLDNENILNSPLEIESNKFSSRFKVWVKKTNKIPTGKKYLGNIISNFNCGNENIKKISLKWLNIKLKNKIFSISPSVYSNSRKTRDNFVKCKIEDKFYFASIQCIVDKNNIYVYLAKKTYKKAGISVVNSTLGLFSYKC